MDLSKYAQKNQDKIKNVRRKFVYKIYSSIVMKTPVDTGRARGNWLIDTQDRNDFDWDNKEIRFTKLEEVPEAKGDESYYIVNNLPYINALEFGHSKQAPNGMVGLTVAKAKYWLNDLIYTESNKK